MDKEKIFNSLKTIISSNPIMEVTDIEDTAQSMILNSTLYENINFIFDLRKSVDIAMLRIEGNINDEEVSTDVAVNQVIKEDENIRVTDYDEKTIFQKSVPFVDEENPEEMLIKVTKEFLNIFIDHAEVFECNLEFSKDVDKTKSEEEISESTEKENKEDEEEAEESYTEETTEVETEINKKEDVEGDVSNEDVDKLLNELKSDYDDLGIIKAQTESKYVAEELEEKDISVIYNEIDESLKEREEAVAERERKLNIFAEKLKEKEEEIKKKTDALRKKESNEVEIKKLKMTNIKLQNEIDTLKTQKKTLEDDLTMNDSVSEIAKLKNIIRKQKEVIEKIRG